MKGGARVALGVAGGYLLGRTKKMKLALMVGGMAAGRRVGGPRELLEQGTKLVQRSPELAKLSDEVRGRLLDSAKEAALAVAARQVDALTERVSHGAEAVTDTVSEARPQRSRAEKDTTGDGSATDEDTAADEAGSGRADRDTGTAKKNAGESTEDAAEPAPRRRGTGTRSRGKAADSEQRAAGGSGTASRTKGTSSTGRQGRTGTRRSTDG